MHRFIPVLAVAVLVGCVRTEPDVSSVASRLPSVDSPNVRVSIQAPRGVDNINIKRGGEASLNFAFGTAERRTVTTSVSDAQYLVFRDLCLAVLRDAPSTLDGARVVNVNLLLLDDQLAQHGLKSNRCTFGYHPGQNRAVDALLKRVTSLLDQHRAGTESE